MSFPLSCIFSAVCATFSYEIADKLMFNADCAPLIQIIAIGIPLSAIHSCICGYYYGCKKTFIPAISQIIEQLIRIFSVIIYYHLISENLEKAYNDGSDRNARRNMMIASTIGGMSFISSNVGAVHAFAETVGAWFDTPHGVANSLFLPYIMEYNIPAC